MTDVISSSALNIKGLFKHFEGKYAVDNLDLDIAVGEFHALLGPNGAGKTTTLRIVAGLLKADAGQVMVLGHNVLRDPQVAKRELAFLPDDPLLSCDRFVEVVGVMGQGRPTNRRLLTRHAAKVGVGRRVDSPTQTHDPR